MTGFERVGPIEDEWRRLAVERGNAFLTPEWSRAWFDTAGRDQEPVIVAATRPGGSLAGVMPLSFDPKLRPRALRFAGAPFGDRFGVAAAREDEDELAVAAIAALEGADAPSTLLLHRIGVESEWPARMQLASRRRLALLELSRDRLPYARVAGLDWEGYLRGRSQKFRQRIGRGLDRAVEREGIEKRVRQTSAAAELDGDMNALFALHDLRRSDRASSISEHDVRRFLVEFARAALDRSWLRLRILELGRAPAAAYLAWRIGGSYSLYQGGFDPAWSEQSAGLLLLNDTVRAAIGERVDEVDLLLGDEPYKWRFAPEPREVRTVALVGAAHPARALLSFEAGLRRRGRGMASRPLVGGVARWVSRRLPGSG